MIKLEDGDYYLTQAEWAAAIGVGSNRYTPSSGSEIPYYERPDQIIWCEGNVCLWRKSRVSKYWKAINEEKEMKRKARNAHYNQIRDAKRRGEIVV